MDNKMVRQARVDEVQDLLDIFCRDHLTQEMSNYVTSLWNILKRKRTYDITKGQKEVWASAVICVICRLNFLFDRTNPHCISMNTIYDTFGTKKSTVDSRAKDIEKACRINIGHEGLCSQEISDALTFIQLPNGIVIPKSLARKEGIIE